MQCYEMVKIFFKMADRKGKLHFVKAVLFGECPVMK